MRYTSRVVAFVDILGLSAALLDAEVSEGYARAVFGIISAITKPKADSWQVLPHAFEERSVEVQFVMPFGRYARLTTISDSIAMSLPDVETENEFAMGSRLLPILHCLEAVFWLQRSLLMLGIRTRGGLAIGRLFHRKDLIVGEGLVRAYALESKTAVYPRVVVSDELIEILLSEPVPEGIALFKNRVAHLLRRDTDGHYFVDYLGRDGFLGSFFLEKEMGPIFRQLAVELPRTEPRVAEKLSWLQDYAMLSMRQMAHHDLYLNGNHGPSFSTIYQRTHENIVTFTDAYVAPQTANRRKDNPS